MPRKPSFSWPLVPDNDPAPADLLTDAELAEVNTLVVPIEALIDQYIEGAQEYPFDTILEALARLQDYYEGMQRSIDAEIDKDMAAEEADA